MDWKQIQKDGLFYVDKTHFIEKLENAGCYLKIWRPRRMGKSLFCNQLRYYYDKAVSADEVSVFVFLLSFNSINFICDSSRSYSKEPMLRIMLIDLKEVLIWCCILILQM